MAEDSENFLEQAQQAASRPAPLAPYWEGRTFDDALETVVNSLHSEIERAGLYERLFALIDRDDPMFQYRALYRLADAFRAEAWEDEEDRPPDRITLQSRLANILAAIEWRLPTKPELLEQFCRNFKPYRCDDPVNDQIRDWLQRLHALSDACPVPANALLAARILYGAYDATWAEAGERLLEALDHEDLDVRACAAYQIGTFCTRMAPDDPEWGDSGRDLEADRRATEGMAPLADYWEMFRRREMDRPGVAGAFRNGAPIWTIDEAEWMLTLLEQTKPEPPLWYFPCNLAFHAHERYSRNPAAVRRLMDAGRTGIALEAATEKNEPVEGMEPLLLELGESDDPEVVRRVSWTLAYNYNRLHPQGERLGFVQSHTRFSDCDLFSLFSARQTPESPYAVVLYPKSERSHWPLQEAQALVDRIFPPAVRGELQPDSLSDESHPWYQRGYVQFFTQGKRRKRQRVTRIIIGYRTSIYWNPVPV